MWLKSQVKQQGTSHLNPVLEKKKNSLYSKKYCYLTPLCFYSKKVFIASDLIRYHQMMIFHPF